MHRHGQQSQPKRSFFRSPEGIALVVFALVGGFYLWSEHRAHVFGALPYILLLACPFMHLFMHRGHGGHAGGDRADDKPN
jgi:hypothetical protein